MTQVERVALNALERLEDKPLHLGTLRWKKMEPPNKRLS
jgi:hypothetical protein